LFHVGVLENAFFLHFFIRYRSGSVSVRPGSVPVLYPFDIRSISVLYPFRSRSHTRSVSVPFPFPFAFPFAFPVRFLLIGRQATETLIFINFGGKSSGITFLKETIIYQRNKQLILDDILEQQIRNTEGVSLTQNDKFTIIEYCAYRYHAMEIPSS